jgi:cell division septal protein FtsQ
MLLGAVATLALTQQVSLMPRVTELSVSGNRHASSVALRHLADVRVGDSLAFVDLDAVVEGVSQHPWVASATVRRVFPGKLSITVVEHQTEMLLLADGLYRVAGDGTVFAKARSSDLDLPILTGMGPDLAGASPVAARGVVRQALRLLSLVEESGAVPLNQVSEVRFGTDLGFSLILRNGSRIHFGYQDPAIQTNRLAALRTVGLDLSRAHEVDLDLDGMAIVTPLAI